MTRPRRTSPVLAAACAGAIFAARANAADVLSTHNSFNGNWSFAGDWSNSPNMGGYPNNGNAGVATYDAFIANVQVTLDVNVTIQALTMTGATITGTNSLTTNGLFQWATGSLFGAGIMNANGGITMAGASRALNTRVLNSSGLTDWGNGVINSGDGAIFNNSGTFNTSFNGFFGFNLGGVRTSLNNTGVFQKTGGSGTTTIEAAFNNSGTARVNFGTLRLTGGGTSSGSFTVVPGTTLEIATQDFNLAAPASITGDGTFRVANNTVTLGGTIDVFTLDISSATLNTTAGAAANSKVLVARTLSLNGKLDLANNAMILNHSGASPLAVTRARLLDGYANGAWNGNGIASSSAASEPRRAIGYAEASSLFGISGTQTASFHGRTVDATAFLMSYTIPGDVNLDGQIGFVDLLAIAASFGINDGSATWEKGDSNYDGNTTFVDLLATAAYFGGSLPTFIPGASDEFHAALASIAVPEPAGLCGVCLTAALWPRRTRRRQ